MPRGGKPYDGGNSIASYGAVMLTVCLPENIDRRLDRLARATGRTKSFYVREGKERVLSSEEVGKMLDGEERGEIA